jgi:hypothetical protein
MDAERPFSPYIPPLGEKTLKFNAEYMEKVVAINCTNGETIFALCYLFSLEQLIYTININEYFS